MNWILCGFKGCGKTHFAAKLDLPHLDTDKLIEKQEELPIPDLVLKKGLHHLRKCEEELLATLDIDCHIIATGGGIVESPVAISHLKRLGVLIFLNAPKALIQKRQLSPPLPTFLDWTDPTNSFERMWSTRIAEYERICDFKIDLENRSEEEVIEALWRVINLGTSSESPHGESLTAKQSES